MKLRTDIQSTPGGSGGSDVRTPTPTRRYPYPLPPRGLWTPVLPYQPCKASKLKCTVGGVPQSTKQAKLAPASEAGPSKGPLFMESEPEEDSASETSEASPAGLAELEGAI